MREFPEAQALSLAFTVAEDQIGSGPHPIKRTWRGSDGAWLGRTEVWIWTLSKAERRSGDTVRSGTKADPCPASRQTWIRARHEIEDFMVLV
jgi:hypothetical protein